MKFNTGSETKKSKCQTMIIGKTLDRSIELKANKRKLEDVTEILYLCDIVCQSGNNKKNIKSLIQKGQGIINNIFMILDNICFGSSFFQTAMLLRRSLLLNGCLFNSSVWHNLSKNDVKDLSRIDQTFFSRLTTISKNSPEEFHYLEFGETDIDKSTETAVLRKNNEKKKYSTIQCVDDTDSESMPGRLDSSNQSGYQRPWSARESSVL